MVAAELERTDVRLDRTYARVTRRILPLLMVGYVAAYLDRVNVGFAKLQMLDDLGFSETVYGLGAGIFFIGYFLFEVPSNVLLSRIGARKWIARIMVSWGFISAAMMFVTTPLSFYILRFALGAAEAGFFPGVIFYLTQWYPDARRGKIVALFMTGMAWCNMFGSSVSGMIMQAFDGISGWAGWQWLFLIEGLAAVLVGIWIFFRLDDRIATVAWLTDAEKASLTADLARAVDTKLPGSLGTAFRDGRVWYASLIYFCLITGLYGLGFWLPTIISEMAVTGPFQIGLLAALPYGVAIFAMVLGARSSDRSGERRWHVAILAAAGASGLVLSVIFADNIAIAMTALTVGTCGVLAALPIFWSLPTAYLRGTAAAAGIAIINSCGNLAGFLSPYAVGALKDWTASTAAGVYLIGGIVLAGAVLVVWGGAKSAK